MMRSIMALLPACLGLCTAFPAAAEIQPGMAEQFACSACHAGQLPEMQRPGAVTLVEHDPRPKLDSGRQDAASTPDMCLSCHDGFVLDSRSLWQDGHRGHPVGMVPSARVARPVAGGAPVFPMNDDGRMYCGTCHSPHYHTSATSPPSAFMRADLDDGALCLSCHRDQASVADGDHAAQPGVCANCHVAHDAQGPVMWALAPGPGDMVGDRLCRSCHEGDAGNYEHPRMFAAWSDELRSGLVADTGAPMPVFDRDGSRAATGVIGCSTCHDAHRQRAAGLADEMPGLFLRRASTEGFLCADCHGPSALRRYQYFHSAVSRGR